MFGFETIKKWDYENGFYLTSDVTRLAKVIAQYELYKSVIDLPGHVIECGVFKGASLIRFITFREILENHYSRKIIGFDAFGKFPKADNFNDKKFIKRFESDSGSGIPIEELKKVFANKSFTNYELIKGDIVKTVPTYVRDHPELKISLLHIDVDVYKPTKVILQYLYDRVVKGGLVLFDDFGTAVGETRAIDEYFRERDVLIETLPIFHASTYIRKR